MLRYQARCHVIEFRRCSTTRSAISFVLAFQFDNLDGHQGASWSNPDRNLSVHGPVFHMKIGEYLLFLFKWINDNVLIILNG